MSAWWRGPLRDVVDGRPVILVGGPAVTWTRRLPVLVEQGAAELFVVGTQGVGVGPRPDVPYVVVDRVEGDAMTAIRADLAAIASPPPHVVEAVEAFDPGRKAVVFSHFLNESATFCGRPVVAHREPEWVSLEDKTRVDALLDRAGVDRAESCVVPCAEAVSTWRQLDRGAGTVWAADSRDGFHGGGTLTRWVTDDEEAAAVTAELAPHCEQVRVMPFLDGIATSIHGIVFPADVVALRPVELVTLRSGRRLRYSGCATFWDPPDGVRTEMREAAQRLGAQLRADVGFRGAFTLDGVATADGFRPTELNPRFGAGLEVITRGLKDLPLHLVLDLVVAGVPLPITPEAMEAEILTEADAQRSGGTWQIHTPTPIPVEDRPVRYEHGEWRWAGADEPVDGTVNVGGNFAHVAFAVDRTPIGPSVGERAAAFWRFADAELGTEVGPLTAPPDVTR